MFIFAVMKKTIILLGLSLVALQAVGQTKKKAKQQEKKIEVTEIPAGAGTDDGPNALDPGIVEPPPPREAGPVQPGQADGQDKRTFTFVEQAPEFPGGKQAMAKFIADHLQYPDAAREAGVEGRVTVRFIVERTGRIKDPEVLRGIGNGCDQEAIRVVKSMPNWRPGKQNGMAVNVYYTLPVIFKLQDEPAPVQQQ